MTSSRRLKRTGIAALTCLALSVTPIVPAPAAFAETSTSADSSDSAGVSYNTKDTAAKTIANDVKGSTVTPTFDGGEKPDNVTLELGDGAPEGASIDSDGTVTLKATPDQEKTTPPASKYGNTINEGYVSVPVKVIKNGDDSTAKTVNAWFLVTPTGSVQQEPRWDETRHIEYYPTTDAEGPAGSTITTQSQPKYFAYRSGQQPTSAPAPKGSKEFKIVPYSTYGDQPEPGITVNDSGLVSWDVPANQKPGSYSYGLQVTYADGSKSLREGFIKVTPAKTPAAPKISEKYELATKKADGSPAYAIVNDPQRGSISKVVYWQDADDYSDVPPSEQPSPVTFTLPDNTDPAFSIDSDTGKITFTPTDENKYIKAGEERGLAPVKVRATYADGSFNEVTPSFSIDRAKKSAPKTTAESTGVEFKGGPFDAPKGKTTTATNNNAFQFKPAYKVLDSIPEGAKFALKQDGTPDPSVSIDPDNGHVSYTPAADLPDGFQKIVEFTVTYKDGSVWDDGAVAFKVVDNASKDDQADKDKGDKDKADKDKGDKDTSPLAFDKYATAFPNLASVPGATLVAKLKLVDFRTLQPANLPAGVTVDSVKFAPNVGATPTVDKSTGDLTLKDAPQGDSNGIVTYTFSDGTKAKGGYSFTTGEPKVSYDDAAAKSGNAVTLKPALSIETPQGNPASITSLPSTYTFSLGSDAPAGASVNAASGVITFTPVDDEAGKTVTIPVTLTYPNGKTTSAEAKVTVSKSDEASKPAEKPKGDETPKGEDNNKGEDAPKGDETPKGEDTPKGNDNQKKDGDENSSIPGSSDGSSKKHDADADAGSSPFNIIPVLVAIGLIGGVYEYVTHHPLPNLPGLAALKKLFRF